MWVLLPILACGAPEPVLPVTAPTRAAVEAVGERRAGQERRATRDAADGLRYVKPTGVYVDGPHLTGRSWEASREAIEAQLGPFKEQAVQSDGTTEVSFERGSVRVLDAKVVALLVPLPEPLRRTDALLAVGLAATTREYLAFTFEYRLINEQGFRRVRMMRTERDSEFVSRVELWRTTSVDR